MKYCWITVSTLESESSIKLPYYHFFYEFKAQLLQTYLRCWIVSISWTKTASHGDEVHETLYGKPKITRKKILKYKKPI